MLSFTGLTSYPGCIISPSFCYRLCIHLNLTEDHNQRFHLRRWYSTSGHYDLLFQSRSVSLLERTCLIARRFEFLESKRPVGATYRRYSDLIAMEGHLLEHSAPGLLCRSLIIFHLALCFVSLYNLIYLRVIVFDIFWNWLSFLTAPKTTICTTCHVFYSSTSVITFVSMGAVWNVTPTAMQWTLSVFCKNSF